ncbi:MAG TPA: hypothetical protein VLA43_14600 [Longimicrobiales bacterium]|nr:hypothetical protein [Longimicrobiales bacterium]
MSVGCRGCNSNASGFPRNGSERAARAELRLEGQTLILEPGDCWVVPRNTRHSYTVPEPFTAVEATSPPARIQGRDGREGRVLRCCQECMPRMNAPFLKAR